MLADWKAYRANSFAFEILETDVPPLSRFDREQHWIDTERAYLDGYNLNPKAESALDRVFGDKHRELISRRTKKQFARPGARAKTSKATRRAMPDPELRKKLSQSAKRKFANPAYREALRRKWETGIWDPAITAAAREARKAREKARVKRRIRLRKQKAYHYRITRPDGSVLLAAEIRPFCRLNGISPGSAYDMINERRGLTALRG